MKIRFLKDITVDAFYPASGDNDTYDRLVRQGVSLEVASVEPVSKDFSTLWLDNGEVLIDIRNDWFEVIP